MDPTPVNDAVGDAVGDAAVDAAIDACVKMHRMASTPRHVHDLPGARAHEQARDARNRASRLMAFVAALTAQLQMARAYQANCNSLEIGVIARAGTLAAHGAPYGTSGEAVQAIVPEF